MNSTQEALFARKANNYLFEEWISFEEAITTDTPNIHLPLVVDTEFKDGDVDFARKVYTPNKTITVQARHINEREGYIFSHPDCRDIARHPLLQTEFIALDYLLINGYKIQLVNFSTDRGYTKDEKVLHVHIVAHFALAELFRIFSGRLRTDVERMVLGRAGKNHITHGRRLQTSNTRLATRAQTWVSFDKHLVYIDGHPFRLRITIWDTIAVLGTQSLEKLAALGSVPLSAKKSISDKEKSEMDKVYLNKPEIFDEYALGDLCVYDVILGVYSQFQRIFYEVGLGAYWKPGETMRMTIGASTAKLFEASLMKEMDIKDVKTLRSLTSHGTSEEIKKFNTTAKYLAKVDGGRCRNNRPTDVSVNSLICDIDIDGCYGNGLRNQSYPLGLPLFIDYKIDSDRNEYETLGSFLKKYRHELIPGLWQIRVSTPEGFILKYPQDFLQSWHPPKNLERLKTDTELEAGDWWTDDNTGLSKIFSHEVNLAIITHDTLQLIENVCGTQQRAELMNNLLVVAAQFYPKSQKVNSVDEALEKIKNHEGKNITKAIGKKRKSKIIVEQECYTWCEINIGLLLVDILLKLRKGYKKDIPEEKIFNILYKLIINTIYGDQVSPFFPIGNTCVGNNITARARAMAWYMEKGFHGFQTITDGCAFELNKVVYPDNGRLTTSTVFNAYDKGTDEGNFIYKPLGDKEITVDEWVWDEENKIYKACLKQNGKKLSYRDIGMLTMRHLQSIFPGDIDVLHKKRTNLKGEEQIGQFTLEVKSVVDGASFHGSANYIFKQSEHYLPAKMRSYRTGKHRVVELINGKLEYTLEDYEPAKEFLAKLLKSPKRVTRGECFIDGSILKPATYKQHYDSRYENSQLFPGCRIERVRLLREFSLNQYTFQTFEQYRTWEREWKRLHDATGQSYEPLFMNEDGTIDVQEMCKSIAKAINKGSQGFFKRGRVQRYLETIPDSLKNHTKIKCLQMAQVALNECYGFVVDGDRELSDEYLELETDETD